MESESSGKGKSIMEEVRRRRKDPEEEASNDQ